MKDITKITSYSAASVFPAKLLKENVLDTKGRIMPIHIQLNPTNTCNFNCKFCFIKDTMILTPSGSVPIQDVKKNDMIISHTGKKRKVLETLKRVHNGNIYRIDIERFPDLYVTPEHPFLIDNKFIEAKNLEKGMKLEVVKFGSNVGGQPKRILHLSKYFKNKRYRSKIRYGKHKLEIGRFRLKDSKHSAPQKMDMDYNFGRFCGLYLSEGHIHKCKNRPNSKVTVFSFGKTETHLMKFVKSFCNKYEFNYSNKMYDKPTSWQITIYNSIFADFIERYFGDNCNTKKIPFELNLNYNFKKGLIKGIFDGDGHYKRFYLNLVDKKLIYQIVQLLISEGFIPMMWKRKGGKQIIEGRIVNAQSSYTLAIVKKQWTVFKLFLKEGVRHWNHLNPLDYKVKIKKITKMKYNGFVYNFEVYKDRTYSAEFIKCHNCSCANRDKGLQIKFEDMKKILKDCSDCGTKAVTITGGGEPLTYKKMPELLELCEELNIKTGLVTNGTLIRTLNEESLKKIVWCRISASDYLVSNLENVGMSLDDWFKGIAKATSHGNVDWAFSYVLTKDVQYDLIAKCIKFANEYNFTHVRIVSDLLDLKNVPDMETVKSEIKKRVDDSLVFYQGRKDHTKGSEKCLISLLKPVIANDCKIYGCCGVQYALANPGKDYEETMCMGDARTDIKDIFTNQKNFDGSICEVCYYEGYNYVLDAITGKIKHKEFI